MAQKVFKIPDGLGGFTYQVQTPDGEWLITDENGNILPPEEPKEALGEGSIPKARRKGRRGSSRRKEDPSYRIFSMRVSTSDYKAISDYVFWRNIYSEPCSRNSVFIEAALEFIQKDREYREFLRRNSPERCTQSILGESPQKSLSLP